MYINTRTLALSAVFALATPILTASCDDEQFEGTISGVAIIKQQIDGEVYRVVEVTQGDNVTLSIGATREHESKLEIQNISGIDYAPEVHYLIDNKEVGYTREHSNFFGLNYTVELEPGEHTLSVDIPQIYNNIDYHINVANSTFVVKAKE